MASSSAGRSDADEPEPSDDSTEFPEGSVEGEIRRTRSADAFWQRVRVDPVEIALPGGVGYTLRAYRMDSEITPSDYTVRQDHGFPDRSAARSIDDLDEIDDLVDSDDLAEDEFDVEEEDVEGEDEDTDSGAPAERADEEVPLFLSHGGQLLVFRTRAGLVDFVRSDADHDLIQLDTWSRVVDDIRPEYVVPLPDDTYELDLVVKNLRGAHDAWDPQLIVQVGQLARDLGHALHMQPVVLALSPGSPLDDLDEALRGVAAGGIGTFFARRKAKKIGTETASLSWRTVIGKISAVVDWRD